MCRILAFLFLLWAIPGIAQTWTRKTSYPGKARWDAAAFTIDSKAYVSTGAYMMDNTHMKAYELYEYNSTSDTWTPKAHYPGSASQGAGAHTIHGKGYIIAADNGASPTTAEYDPSSDQWTLKQPFPASKRGGAAYFTLGDTAYFGLGMNSQGTLTDLWAYDALSNTWKEKKRHPGMGQGHAAQFTIGNNAYVVGGYGTENEVWMYDASQDEWKRKNNAPFGLAYAAGFSVCGKGYVSAGTGLSSAPLNELWEYDPLADSWKLVGQTPFEPRSDLSVFVINDKAYLLLGLGASEQYNDMWEFDPAVAPPMASCSLPASTVCPGAMVEFINTSTNAPSEILWLFPGGIPASSTRPHPKVRYRTPGSYDVTLIVSNCAGADTLILQNHIVVEDVTAGFFMSAKYGYTPLTVSFSNTSSGAVDYSWSFGNGSSAASDPSNVYTLPGTYTITLIATSANNCSDSFSDTVKVKEPFLPNVFTPNGDNVNDVFAVAEDVLSNGKIFNRWGNVVYEWKNTPCRWNGDGCSNGTYYYHIELSSQDNSAVRKGFVTLTR